MIIDLLKDSILENIGPLKQSPKNWYKRNCMLCHTQGHSADTRSRFGIQFNSTSIALNCFNCGFSAGFTEGKGLSKSMKFFMKQINISDEFIRQIEFEIFKQRNNLGITREGYTFEDKDARLRSLFSTWKTVSLPEGSFSLQQWLDLGTTEEDFLNVLEYTLSRKINDLNNFYWCPDTHNNLNQRLIIPYYYKNKIVGFTSRLYYNSTNKEIPKYYQQCPTDFVYNLDSQQEWSRKYVIVTEGVLDAWAVDGVAVLGELGQAKIDIINRLQKRIIVCSDRDKKGSDLIDAAIANKWDVAFPKWLHWERKIKDASKASEIYGRLLTTHSIIDSAISNPDKIIVKWKYEQNTRDKMRVYG